MKLFPQQVFARLTARIIGVKQFRRRPLKTALPTIAECILETRLMLSASWDDDIAAGGDTSGGDTITGGAGGDTTTGAAAGDTTTGAAAGDTTTDAAAGDTTAGSGGDSGSNCTPPVTPLLVPAAAIPNPLAAIKAMPLDGVWIQNRVLTAIDVAQMGLPLNQWVGFSHTFVVTTDETGKVLKTYSWGNHFDKEIPSNWYENEANDIAAAEKGMKSLKAVQDGKLTIEDLKNAVTLGTWGTRVGGSDLIPYINKAYQFLRYDPKSPSQHEWGVLANCKDEADYLVQYAKSLYGLDVFAFMTGAGP